VLLAFAPGSLLLPFEDGRDVGRSPDPLLQASLAVLFGPLGAPIDSSDDGATPSTPIVLPPGLSPWAVGLQADFAGTVRFGDVSGPVPISL
jgi:hypothetical protein